jgi:hypothetical protein
MQKGQAGGGLPLLFVLEGGWWMAWKAAGPGVRLAPAI